MHWLFNPSRTSFSGFLGWMGSDRAFRRLWIPLECPTLLTAGDRQWRGCQAITPPPPVHYSFLCPCKLKLSLDLTSSRVRSKVSLSTFRRSYTNRIRQFSTTLTCKTSVSISREDKLKPKKDLFQLWLARISIYFVWFFPLYHMWHDSCFARKPHFWEM